MPEKNESGLISCDCIDHRDPKTDPYPIVTLCPRCGVQHIDEGEFATRKHKTHQCQNDACPTYVESMGKKRHEWTPALMHTVGVKER